LAGTNLIDEYLRQINELEKQAAPLREERNQLNDESRNWIEKRDSFNTEIKRLREAAFSYKDKRDDLNKVVKELKSKRDQTKEELLTKREQLNSISERIWKFESKVTLRERAARRQFRELEWKLQTNSFSLAEENQIIVKVKSLELELANYRGLLGLKKEAHRLLTEIKELQSAIGKHHSDLSRLAKDSQECHEHMINLFVKTDQLSEEAGDSHQNYIEVRRKATVLHKSHSKLIARIKEIELLIRKTDGNVHREQIRKALQSRKRLGETAEQKLQMGEKLTFEEFKILLERGEI